MAVKISTNRSRSKPGMSTSTAATSPLKDATDGTFTPKIIGLHGLPGAGKSTLLKNLKKELNDGEFLIADEEDLLCPNEETKHADMEQFMNAEKTAQRIQRTRAIKNLPQRCRELRKHAIVVGHFMFWEDAKQQDPKRVWTETEAEVHTHVIFLSVKPGELSKRRANDTVGNRPKLEEDHLLKWQRLQEKELRATCYENGIPFITISDGDKLKWLIEEFVNKSPADCDKESLHEFRQQFGRLHTGSVDKVLVFDADKTMSAADSGELPFEGQDGCDGALEKTFGSKLDYTLAAFYQSMLLFEEMLSREEWEERCKMAAEDIKLQPGIETILRQTVKNQDLGVVVVTCGIGKIWEHVLENAGLRESIIVIGRGRLKDNFCVTPGVKRSIVKILQKEKDAFVWAFGHNQLDLPMLEQADEAIVVVCDEEIWSKSIDEHLKKSMGLSARQLLTPSNVRPRLDGSVLPIIDVDGIISEVPLINTLQLIHATNASASKILRSDTRNKDINGLALQDSHRQIGHYLVVNLLPKVVGLETYPITTVQDDVSQGHRVRNEAKTVIVTCMRGDDDLAQGVLSALPSATYFHANEPDDLEKEEHKQAVQGAKNILLCDFVVNEGDTLVQMIKKIRHELNRGARIVMVAGVVQADAVKEGSNW